MPIIAVFGGSVLRVEVFEQYLDLEAAEKHITIVSPPPPSNARTGRLVSVRFGQVGWHRVRIVYCKQNIVI